MAFGAWKGVGAFMRRRLVAGAAAVLLALALTPTAWADEWCQSDPPVIIRTPAGKVVVVHVTNYALGRQHLKAVVSARIDKSVRPAANGRGTDVGIDVVIPNDAHATGFPVRSVVSTGPFGRGTVYDDESGVSGNTLRLRFTLDVP